MPLDLPPLPHTSELNAAEDALRQAGLAWGHDQQDWQAHLRRHAPDSLTVGSKFSRHAWNHVDQLVGWASAHAKIALARCVEQGHALTVEISLPLADAGTQGVVSSLACAGLSTLTRTQIMRDPGTIYEQLVELVVLTDDQPFPKAQAIMAPAGKLWESEQVGLYTLFPGSKSRPLPREDKALTDPEGHALDVAFWRDHHFVATPRQALDALQKAQALPGHPSTALQRLMRDEFERVSLLTQDYRRTLKAIGRP